MTKTIPPAALLGLALSLAGCAAASRGGGYDRTVITPEEIEAAEVKWL